MNKQKLFWKFLFVSVFIIGVALIYGLLSAKMELTFALTILNTLWLTVVTYKLITDDEKKEELNEQA